MKTSKISFVIMETTTVAKNSEKPSDRSQTKFMTLFYRKMFTELKLIEYKYNRSYGGLHVYRSFWDTLYKYQTLASKTADNINNYTYRGVDNNNIGLTVSHINWAYQTLASKTANNRGADNRGLTVVL